MAVKKYRKGKHTYTDWGSGTKEVKKVNENKVPVKKQLQIKLDEATAEGKYSNFGSISHTPEEFILDFIFIPPGPQGAAPARVVSRIIASPGHAKRLAMALNDNVAKYEAKHGKISPSKTPEPKIGFN